MQTHVTRRGEGGRGGCVEWGSEAREERGWRDRGVSSQSLLGQSGTPHPDSSPSHCLRARGKKRGRYSSAAQAVCPHSVSQTTLSCSSDISTNEERGNAFRGKGERGKGGKERKGEGGGGILSWHRCNEDLFSASLESDRCCMAVGFWGTVA